MKTNRLTAVFPTAFHPQSLHWPTQFEGSSIHLIPALPNQRAFVGLYPGATTTFQSAGRNLIIRHATRGTRRLHAIETCLREAGYQITRRSIDSENWLTYFAINPEESLHIRERISDGSRSWTQPSSWFWHATLHPHAGPWQATTVITPISTNPH